MKLLGLDFETSGLEPDKHVVLEVGMVLWDVDQNVPVWLSGFLVKWPSAVLDEVPWDELYPINGITRAMVETYGWDQEMSLYHVHAWAKDVDMMVAHNGTMFDKLFLEAWTARYSPHITFPGWVDTRLDLPEPLVGSLTCQAAQKGFLNPFPHRALTDVLTMMRILSGYDLNQVIERAKLPNITVAALGLPFDRKQEAKDRGYYADYKDGKFVAWKKTIKACDLEKEAGEAGFRVFRIDV